MQWLTSIDPLQIYTSLENSQPEATRYEDTIQIIYRRITTKRLRNCDIGLAIQAFVKCGESLTHLSEKYAKA